MKKIILGLIAVIVMSCESVPFKANVNNDLLVGAWTISEVDDSAAMISKEEFLLTAIHEKYKVGYTLNFEKGPKFTINSTQGKTVASGNYAISADNKSVTLQFAPDNTEFSYDLAQKNNGYGLTATTAGELVNLSISK